MQGKDVMATEGAALRCSMQGLIDADASLGKVLSRARFLVLDEADRLLEPSFEAELATTLSLLPAQRQTLLFSATMTKSLIALQKVGWGLLSAIQKFGSEGYYIKVVCSCFSKNRG